MTYFRILQAQEPVGMVLIANAALKNVLEERAN